jgi:antitoxin YefM
MSFGVAGCHCFFRIRYRVLTGGHGLVLLLVLEASADPHAARLLGWTELGHGTATGDTVRIGQLVFLGNSAANLSGPVQAFYCPEDIELGPQAPVSGIVALTWHIFLVILLTMTTLPLGEVKSHLSELVNRVHEHHERVTVTVHGRPSAVLVATEDLERLEETLAILRDSETVSRLATSDAELARGESVSAEELAAAMRRPSSR